MVEISSDPAELGKMLEGKSDDDINASLAAQYEGTLGQIFEGMKSHFLPEKAAGQTAVVQYDIKAPDKVYSFQLKVADGKCEVIKGAAGPARVTLALTGPDFLRLISGKLNGMQAFFSGKLKLSGDMMFAQTMQNWFKQPG